MAAIEHRYGECYIVAQVRLVGDQPVAVQGVTSMASRDKREHVVITVGRVLIYLEDRGALDALAEAVRRASEHADAVFGPLHDAFGQAEARARADIARKGRLPQK
ncbi:MAG: hypothetical protein M3042_07760 [Actinomycetota bacterium]|nr:hypothetical protein [Actinomycetota bacterium]